MGGCVQSYNAPGNVKYTYAQLEGIWIQAGGNPQIAATAAAIAMAESGGNSTATCVDSNNSTDRGLWQINNVHGTQSTYDVMNNAKAAVAISGNGTNFNAWTTYTSGAYAQFVQGTIPDTNVPINATNAAANQPQQAQLTGFSLPGPVIACNPLTLGVAPWMCVADAASTIGGAATGFFGSSIQKYIDYAILQTVKVVLNPFMNFFGGVIGVLSGTAIMGFGIYLLVMESESGQQAVRAGVGAGALAAGQPELAVAAQRGGIGSVSRGRMATQQLGQRQQMGTDVAAQRQGMAIAAARIRSQETTQELLRRQALLYQQKKRLES